MPIPYSAYVKILFIYMNKQGIIERKIKPIKDKNFSLAVNA